MSLSIKEEEQLSETVKEFPVLYDKAAKGYKEKDAGKAATGGLLCKKMFLEFNKIHRKTPVPDSLFK